MTSSLHSGATHAILSAGNDVVELYPPKWLIWTTVAMWNSGLEILDAKDKIQEGNYTNAFRHGENALELVKFLPILVK